MIAELPQGRATFHALLPGPLAAMQVEMPERAARGSGVKVRVAVPEARGRHAIRLSATRPDGTAAAFWEQNLIVDRGPVDIMLPVAFNDPPGAWSVTFRDVFGSETAVTRRIEVE